MSMRVDVGAAHPSLLAGCGHQDLRAACARRAPGARAARGLASRRGGAHGERRVESGLCLPPFARFRVEQIDENPTGRADFTWRVPKILQINWRKNP